MASASASVAVPPKQSGADARPPVKQKKQKKPKDWRMKPVTIFYFYFAASLLSAFYAPIHDADEVFNYWEPTHYLTHGSGSQTWEYSPEYAIRSWAYVGIHAAVIRLSQFIPYIKTPVGQFFFLRIVFSLVYSAFQTRFTFSISWAFGVWPALCYTMISTTSAGLFHASTAYLPASLSMYAVIMATGHLMSRGSASSLSKGLTAISIGSLLGWPFAIFLVIPVLMERFIIDASSGRIRSFVSASLSAALKSGTFLLFQCAVDSAFYLKGVCVPWNIVSYNVFGGSNHGPELFGTEPLDFYFRNLLLNFNLWFILAVLAIPILLLRPLLVADVPRVAPLWPSLAIVSPFYLWLATFSLQPHKEERFMYPVYPFLCLNAALSLHAILLIAGSAPLPLISRISPRFKIGAVGLVAIAAVNLNLLRNVRLHSGYFAPLEAYNQLHEPGMTGAGNIVCLGKEWYRFPSSYFLPSNTSARFIRSSFRGLLPGNFEGNEQPEVSRFFPAAGIIPRGMNNLNVEDEGKYVTLDSCTFLVDAHMPSTIPSGEEPDYVHDTENWERITCLPFLDSASTTGLDRIIWLPNTLTQLLGDKAGGAQWGEYCLLKRREDGASEHT